jgi:hypothetical protein
VQYEPVTSRVQHGVSGEALVTNATVTDVSITHAPMAAMKNIAASYFFFSFLIGKSSSMFSFDLLYSDNL